MTVYRVRVIALAVSVVLVCAFACFPSQAQHPSGPPPGEVVTINSLYDQIVALTARVSKLEGNITAADLAGTYAVHAFQNTLYSGFPARVESLVTAGTATLSADGTGSFSGTDTGYQLTQGAPWSLTPFATSEPSNFTWTYAEGTLTISDPVEGDLTLSVAAGGRIAINTNSNPPPTSDGVTTLIIVTRLQ